MADDSRHLNLRALADEDVGEYELVRFTGREAISEPFDYRLELLPLVAPGDVSAWIGKLVEWNILFRDGSPRGFAGRIFETELAVGEGGLPHILLRVRPAFFATAYARATHFVQDRNTQQIFEAVVADVPGLQTSIALSPAPPQRTYAVRYDETELAFVERLFAQDGIFYYFTYDESAGAYRHRMHVANAPTAYGDVPGGDDMPIRAASGGGKLSAIGHVRRARPAKHEYHALNINKADTPWIHKAEATGDWGRVYAHSYEDLIGEATATGDVSGRGGQHGDAYAQEADTVSGSGSDTGFFAGGRIAPDWPDGTLPERLVLTSVTHEAQDRTGSAGGGAPSYSNSFTAIDASKAFRPAMPHGRRRAAGPVLGTVKSKEGAAGEAVVDDQSRVPVAIAHARDYSSASKPLSAIVWLPVQQAWSSGTHGAQFFPRIGTRVVVDFLYGDPDLPFVSGTLYTPTAAYPFDPASKVTQTGWRSVTDKNGSITQELMFEDKPGGEEVYLYTGRDYRRLIDNDETATVKHDQILTVENDQTETIKHDQTVTINNNQTLTVDKDRALTVTGKLDETVTKTHTVTVTDKSLLESKKEIELKVGTSSIKLTLQGIEIKAPMITIKAEGTLAVSAGASAEYKAPLTQVNADATLILKGGVVMIN